MRKRATLLATATLLLVLAACGDTAAGPDGPGGAPTPQPPPTAAPPTTQPPPTAAPPTTQPPPTTVAPPTTQPPTTKPPTTTTTVPPTTAPVADPVADGSGCTPGPGTLGDGRWFGFLEASAGDELTFDLACWFSGDAAVRAAAQDGAEPPPNDYYVRNDNPLVRTLRTTADAEVVWYPQLGDPGSETTTTFADWDAARGQRGLMPGLWVTIKGGVVTSIHEQWVP